MRKRVKNFIKGSRMKNNIDLVNYLQENFETITQFEELFYKGDVNSPIMCNLKFETDKDLNQIKNIIEEADCKVMDLSKVKNIWNSSIHYTNFKLINEEKPIRKSKKTNNSKMSPPPTTKRKKP